MDCLRTENVNGATSVPCLYRRDAEHTMPGLYKKAVSQHAMEQQGGLTNHAITTSPKGDHRRLKTPKGLRSECCENKIRAKR